MISNKAHLVRISITGGPAVLKVTVALCSTLPGDADAGAAVGDAVRELLDAARLVGARQALFVALAVNGNMLLMPALELLNGGLDVLHAAIDAHLLGGEVAVQAGAVPVARDGLGVERNLGSEFFCHAVQEEACY